MKKQNRRRYFAIFMILNLLFEIISPTVSLALTNGSVQPEFIGFEPANSSEMVNLFTGDFKYNIPLMDVDGYPLNLSYHAGSTMETEASWVGLGWSLSPGILNRMMKGLPDDFNGDQVSSSTRTKPLLTSGIGSQESTWFGKGFSISAFYTPVYSCGNENGTNDAYMLTYNNQKGYGREKEHDSHFSWFMGTAWYSENHNTGDGYTNSSQDGGSFSATKTDGEGYFADKFTSTDGSSANSNTRSGIVTNAYSSSTSARITSMFGMGLGHMTSIPSGAISYAPKMPYDLISRGASQSFKAGFWARASLGFGLSYFGINFSVDCGDLIGLKHFSSSTEIENELKVLNSYGFLYSQNADKYSLRDFNRFRDQATLYETPNASIASSTYDLFFASAQGMGSSFRPFRSDVQLVNDPQTKLTGTSSYIGLEIGGPLIVHALKENSSTTIDGTSGMWNTGLVQSLGNTGHPTVVQPVTSSFSLTAPEAFIESAYYKELGELTERDANFESSLNNDALVSPQLIKVGGGYNALSPISGVGRLKRDKRTKHIECLTASQANMYGVEKKFNLYDKNTFSINSTTKLVSVSATSSLTNINRTEKNSAVAGLSHYLVNDHISEVSITNTSGDRYVYGIPAYNLSQKKVLFNASSRKELGYLSYSGARFTNPATYSNDPLNMSDPCQFVQYANTDITTTLRGNDNLLKIDETPAYASSFLLSDILSSDYVDITGDGPSYDDLGNFTKFNYSKENDYKWRAPFCLDPSGAGSALAGSITTNTSQAYFDGGLICDEIDDKAMYEYGIRENYYVHSIESKNFVAVFKTSVRGDAMGVQAEVGTMGTTGETLKLDAVELYSKNEIIAKGGISNAIPVKAVHFEYDYTLCQGTFNTLSSTNTTRGKLTLKKVYFTYGSSKKSALSPYNFSYADNDHNSSNNDENNFSYAPGNVDRWGLYKPNTGTAVGDISSMTLNNTEFPYPEQNKLLADQYAAAWNLTEIKTPTGATIKITYEADDYAYIQDEPTAQMCKIYDCVQSISSPNVNVLTTYGNSSVNIKDKSYLIIDLSHMGSGINASTSLSDANTYARKKLFNSAKDADLNNVMGNNFKPLYFKCFLKVAGPECGPGISKNYYDFINGYCDLEDVGLFDASITANTYTSVSITGTTPVTCYRFAYVAIKRKMAFTSQSVNPISLAGWDFLRNYVPRIAYPGSEPENMGDPSLTPQQQLNNALVGMDVSKIDLANGQGGVQDKRFYDQDYCTTLYPAKSFVKVYSSNYRKFGGGHRVKQIITEDDWAGMTSSTNTSGYSENSTTYGQSFDYTVSVPPVGSAISSGVASYEPMIGGDENSMRQPIPFEVDKVFAPDDHFFQEHPLGEMLYPSPLIGYSKVTVKAISDPTVTNVAGIGKTEFSFYTAKDFPLTDTTTVASKEYDNYVPKEATLDHFIKRLDNPKYEARKIFHMTQGNLLKFNDMHGKLWSIAVFGEDNTKPAVSKIEYKYKTKSSNLFASQKLATEMLTINEKNVISTKTIARDIDVTADTRENITTIKSSGQSHLFEMGCSVIPIFIFPFVIPIPDIPNIHEDLFNGDQKFGFRGATITKVVQEYGILEKVISTFNGMTSTTTNLLWDGNTGNVLLTSTQNNFDQLVYNFNYPAYWGYSEMGHEFKRDGIALNCPSPSTVTSGFFAPWDPTTGILDFGSNTDPVIFEKGDEVMVADLTTNLKIGNRFWIILNPGNSSTYLLVDQDGTALNTSNFSSVLNSSHAYQVKLVRPINRNNLNAYMGGIVSLNNPIPTGASAISYTTVGQKILDAYSQEYCAGASAFLNEFATQQKETDMPFDYYNSVNNPMVAGMYGDFKPTNYYKYKITRNYGSTPNDRVDGIFSSFVPFWTYPANADLWTSLPTNSCNISSVNADDMSNTIHGNWKVHNRNMFYSPYGQLIQTQNSIGIISAQRFGFQHTLPILSASNAPANQVGFDSFEEYAQTYPYLTSISTNTANIFNNDYLGFYAQSSTVNGSTKPAFTNAAAHMGRYSMLFNSNQSVTLRHYTTSGFSRPYSLYADVDNCNCFNFNHILNCSKLNLEYKPYVLSMWVKGTSQATDYSNLITLSVKQTFTISGSPVTSTTTYTPVKSSIINGWQKLDYEITLAPPSSAASASIFEITLSAGSSGGFYLDDFRIQPFNSTMICNVYDPYQLKLWAQMDDRNYATIYEYDNEGLLVRKKKETQNAIFTVQESRSGNNKR